VPFACGFGRTYRSRVDKIQKEGYSVKIVFYEMKKIWSLKIVVMLAFLCGLFYVAFLSFYIDYYPNGHPHTENVALCAALTERYGTTLEPEELEEYVAEMEIAALDDLEHFYEFFTDPSRLSGNGQEWSEAYRARLEEIMNTDEVLGILPEHTLSTTYQYAKTLVVLVILTTLLCLSPLLTTDRMRKVYLLQYTSKQGRGIVSKQLAAILLSSIVLTTALLLVFGAVYATNGTQIFWNNYVSSFYSFYITTIRLTFGQYVCVLVFMMYLVGAALSAFVFILSRFSPNYIALIAGLIPVFVAGAMLCNKLFTAPLNNFDSGMALFEPVVCAVALVSGVIAAVGVVRREMKIDIV
jgi:hypothetical protein